MSAVVTKQHRLSVARAWEGDKQEPRDFVKYWVDTGNHTAGYLATGLVLERLAQLVADAEGVWIPYASAAAFPQVGDRVLCLSTCGDHMILDYAGAGDFTDPEDDQVTFAVSHWRPLPAGPKPSERP